MRRLLLVLAVLLSGTSVSAQWITQNGVTATRFPIRLIPISQPAGTPLEGTFYYDASAHTFKVWSGTTWVAVGSVTAAALGTTSTDGLTLQNTTPANATTTVQISPRLKWCGTGWNSSSAASETDCFIAEVLPATVAGATTARFNVSSSIAGGTYANVFSLNSTGTANDFRIPNGSNTEYGGGAWSSNFFNLGTTTNAGTARSVRLQSPNALIFASGASVTDWWQMTTAGLISALAGNPVIATAPTDSTAVDAGSLPRLRSSSTITPATAGVGNCGAAFLAAALTADCTIATLPAGMKLVGIYADVTVGFTCSGTCSGTKVVQCGTAAGGTQILAAGLNVAATGQFGLADADLGSGMTRAAAIQGGLIGSWSSTTPVSCRFTSGTGNWGSGAATFVNAGSIKFTLVTEQVK
jgi:hypothetical protein